MSKITVKHYLNTNLKPYIINGEKYYTIYALVTAHRQNTKVKSKAFNEYYTEKDFIEITDENSKEDYSLLTNEAKTIENITIELINKIDIFDTVFFSAIYNYYQEIFVFDLDIQIYKNENTFVDLYEENKNKLGIEIDNFFIKDFSLNENSTRGMSLYTWFSPKGQKELTNFLIESNCKYEIEKAVLILNDIVFENSFRVLKWILKGNQKYNIILEKYNHLFENIYASASYEQIGLKN